MRVSDFIEVISKGRDMEGDFYFFIKKKYVLENCDKCGGFIGCHKELAICKIDDFIIIAGEGEEKMQVINIPLQAQVGDIKFRYDEGEKFEDIPNIIMAWYKSGGDITLMNASIDIGKDIIRNTIKDLNL